MMDANRGGWKKHGGKVINISLVTLLFILIFVPDAKSWMMRQLIRTGIFNARVDKPDVNTNKHISELGLTFRDSAGREFSASSIKGKIVFINFWATWCPPCRAEMPSLDKLYKEFQNDRDFVFLFVSEDEEPAQAIEYMRVHKYNLPTYSASGVAQGNFYSGTLPTTLLFDKSGKLVHKQEGMANYNTRKFIASMRALQ
ncbi:MAG: TlpA family protein disulfide reductase [Chitinophagaceae bacterium]|nr:MAG: TlpA family protein disulfide reductase [Chitinophagaceae bacterium]